MQIDKNLYDFVSLLEKHEVAYMVIGGYALGFHGLPRYTGDLDIWIKVSEENADKMMLVAREFPIPQQFFSRDDFLNQSPMFGIAFGNRPLRIEILNSISGVSFDECFPRHEKLKVHQIEIKFIHLKDLLRNKIESGRPKDLRDVEEIEAELKRKREK